MLQSPVLPVFACPSPLGGLEISASDAGVTSVNFTDSKIAGAALKGHAYACVRQLEEYFSGRRKNFELPLDFQGTDFQVKVWKELLKIPFGKTISYLQLARRLGDEKVIRAAASANGKNPIAIIVPCHRVIGSNNELVGYAGGMHRKKWLLEFESGAIQSSLW